MQRAAFPELQGPPRPSRHRQPDRPDRVLIGLKVATCVAAAGLLGVIVLLITAGAQPPAARQSPTVPKIVPSPRDDAPTTTTTTELAPPALQSDTAEIAGTAPVTTTSRPPRTSKTQKPPRQPDFAVIGERCSNPGQFSVTRQYQPVMCFRRFPADEPRWVPVF